MKRLLICSSVFIAFAIKLWNGFAPPVMEPGDMTSGAMNDPFAVVVSAVMTAFAVWVILKVLFWLVSKLMK